MSRVGELVEEGLRYFELSGDAGDKLYVAAIRAALSKNAAVVTEVEALHQLLRDLLPAVEAYELTGRESYRENGVLHWRLTPQFYAAHALFGRIEEVLK